MPDPGEETAVYKFQTRQLEEDVKELQKWRAWADKRIFFMWTIGAAVWAVTIVALGYIITKLD